MANMYLLRTSCGWSTALGTGEMQQRRGDESEDPEHLGCSGLGLGVRTCLTFTTNLTKLLWHPFYR